MTVKNFQFLITTYYSVPSLLDTPCKSFQFKTSISQFLLKLVYYAMKTCLGYLLLKFYAKLSGRSGGIPCLLK